MVQYIGGLFMSSKKTTKKPSPVTSSMASEVDYTPMLNVCSKMVLKFDGTSLRGWEETKTSLEGFCRFYGVKDVLLGTKEDPKAAMAVGLVISAALVGEARRILSLVPDQSGSKLYKTLREVYEQQKLTKSHRMDLRVQLHRLQMKPGETMGQYILRGLLLLAEYRAVGGVMSDQDFAAILKSGLPDKYRPALISVHFKEEDNLEEVKAALLEAEDMLMAGGRSAEAKKESSSDGQAFRTTTKKRGGKRCYHCKKLGHVEAQCWEKHPELKQERKNQATRRNHATSAARKGHSPGASEPCQPLRMYSSTSTF
eukprot:jgi/Mesvir1/26147/Mv26362-RA.1